MIARLDGTWVLVRFALRRDRVLLPAWVGVLAAMGRGQRGGHDGLYAHARERVAAAEAINASPAIVALYGPVLDTSSVGEPGTATALGRGDGVEPVWASLT